jgi:UDP-N-acetylglucosamine--N-acetylmuramyl-(pentapeptide) pyrophosphoryl-undecaprenol N-acetylglucosamine transferase
MNVVLAGGGTGGHLYPAIAIADELKKKYGAAVTFVGTADRLEAAIVPQAGYQLETITAKPFSRSLGFVAANIKGIFQSRALVRKLKPDIIIATGGYVCFPFVVAARFRFKKIPIALLEPNAQSGLANRILTPLVEEIWRDVPVRKTLENVKTILKEDARKRLGLDSSRNVLLVMGGSQGARSINDATLELATKNLLPENWQVLLLAGKLQTPIPSTPRMRVLEYLDDMADAYAAADLVLARAGASTLAELRAVGLPAILVPYPHAAGNHQEANARAYAAVDPAIVLPDAKLGAEALARAISEASKLPKAGPSDNGESAVDRILARIEGLLSRM